MNYMMVLFFGICILLGSCKSDSSHKHATAIPFSSIAEARVSEAEQISMPDTTRFLVREVSPKVALNEAFAERQLVRIEKDSLLNFPGSTISRVIFQELNGRGGHGLESVFEIRTGKSKELRPAEYQPFLELLHNPKSYGQYTAACHDPRVGLIFYNESDHIIGYISLCLACNNVYTRPRLAGLGLSYQDAGFSKISRKKLRELFANWGFPDDYLGIFDGVTGEE